MAKPFLRVGLSGAEADFVPVIVQAGVPLLDKWNNNGALLGNWLGRFVAVAEWEADTVNCYLRDDDGGRLEGIPCAPATEADLQGELKQEFEDLKDRLQKVVPQSPLSGVTRDADNPQQAVPDARVEVRLGGHVKQLTSAANGGFTMGDVPAGTVEVTAQAAGYLPVLLLPIELSSCHPCPGLAIRATKRP